MPPLPPVTTQRVSRGLSLAVALVGGAVLGGWWTGFHPVTTVLPGLVSMKPNTALCLLMIAVALHAQRGPSRRLAQAGVLLVLALTSLTFIEIVTSGNYHIDLVVPFIDLRGDGAQMSPATAVALSLLCVAFLLQSVGRGRLAQFMVAAPLLVGYVAVVGYLYGASPLYTAGGYTSMALHTALSILALGAALLLKGHGETVGMLLTDRGSAGSLIRGLLPWIVVGPAVLGWLQGEGRDAGLYDVNLGTGILVAGLVASLVALLVRTGLHLQVSDRQRSDLIREVVQINRHLEDTVAERTADLSAIRARFQAAFASTPLGTALTTTSGTIEIVNRQLPMLTKLPAETLVGGEIDALFLDEHEAREHALRREALVGSAGSYQLERRLRRDGDTCWVRVNVAVVADETGTRGLLYQLDDITARKAAEERADHLALHDPLTDLPNRTLLLDRLRHALVQAARTGLGVGVLFIDLDRFKFVNDSLGHHVGDALLTEVGSRLRQAARAGDTVGRIGGDEFVVVCPGLHSEQDLLTVAAAARVAVREAVVLDGALSQIDASVGVAFGTGHEDADELLRQADQAMYHAKSAGRARFEVFDDDLRSRLRGRLDTELAIRGAVQRDEIKAWFQPIVDLTSGAVVATEALARWRRPGRGLTPPAEFVPVAEELGCIGEIGSAVLRQACLAATKLPGSIAMSVNVSAQQFVRTDLPLVVESALSLSGLSPDRLWLELTESAVVEAVDSAARDFQSLRAMGVRLAIDDFGTGFSSFSHLRNFPVDLIKIDTTFTAGMERSAHDLAIVEGIVRLADSLGLDVVAEGIETQSQRDQLTALGCRWGQGYLFAKPSPFSEIRFAPPVPLARSAASAPR